MQTLAVSVWQVQPEPKGSKGQGAFSLKGVCLVEILCIISPQGRITEEICGGTVAGLEGY